MLRSMKAPSGVALLLAVAAAVSGCGGGSSGTGTGAALNVPPVTYGSFTAFQAGATTTTALFQDQGILFDFGQTVDAAPFGGLYSATVGAPPTEFVAVSVVASGVPYHAFVNQQAARQAFRLYPNQTAAAQLPSYIVGRHATLPRMLVVDPVVTANNPFGLPPSPGFTGPAPATPPPAPFEYVYVIPQGSALSVGGSPYPSTDTIGGPNPFNLPFPLNPFGTSYSATQFGFAIGPGTGPDPVPPRVDAIIPMSVNTATVPPTYTPVAGTPADPLPHNGVIKIVFSKRISRLSVDPLTNLTVRNLNISLGGAPAILPGTLDRIDPITNALQTVDTAALLFTPSGGSFGPGVNATTGYSIEVSVNPTGDPTISPILGTPQGTTGVQLAVENSLLVTATTQPCTVGSGGCLNPALAITESFNSTTKLDTTFNGTWGTARWNASSDPGKLSGRLLSGSPLGTSIPSLGSRIQVAVQPTPLGTNPAGLFSPFDATLAATTACGAACGATGCNLQFNPGGGAHIMHLYEVSDLQSTKEALEYVEWAPVANAVTPTTYPTMSIWCAITSATAPITSPPATATGLATTFSINQNVVPFQSNDPTVYQDWTTSTGNPNNITPAKGRVLVYGPQNYVTTAGFAPFFGYPLFTTPFDYATSSGTLGTGNNLALEMNIEQGAQCPNFHRYRAGPGPPRRIIGPPISITSPTLPWTAPTAGYDIYQMRFTFVGRRSSVRSLWYDTGLANPIYSSFILDPSPVPNGVGGNDPLLQPAGTQTVWTIEGLGGTTLPLPSALPAFSGVIVDATGGVQPTSIGNMIGRRFYRFRAEFLGNATANTVPSFNNLSVVF
jgi:hypothetical protein